MQRVMQSTGAEIIHLGHNRSVAEIVDCAIQGDTQVKYRGAFQNYAATPLF
jgi:methylmalonyl-CoA mutase